MCNGQSKRTSNTIVTWLAVFFVGSAFLVPAQVYYTTNPEYLRVKKEQNNVLSAYHFFQPDTLVTNIGNYFPRNFMGNLGLASPNYQLRYGTDALGFRLWQAPLQNDRIYDQDVEYYRTKGPFADLTGIAGSKEFQIFKALFTHTYRDKLNVTLRFNRYTSKGFYQRQQTYTNNFFLSSNATSKNRRAGYYLYLLNNGNKNSENGGIQDGRLNDSTMGLNKEIMRVNLSQASRDNREMKVMVNPWLRLNKRSDSTTKGDHYLQYKARVSFLSNRYKDEGISSDNFYRTFYVDTLLTIDSSHVFQWRNELNYTWRGKKANSFSVAYANEFNKVHQYVDSIFFNHLVSAEWHFNKLIKKDSAGKTKTELFNALRGEYIAEGPNAGNFKVENTTRYDLNSQKKNSIYLDLLLEKRSADYIYNTWLSNHFYWFNKGFTAQQQFQAQAGLKLGGVLDLSVFAQSITNYLYFDSLAEPAQLNTTLTNVGLQFSFVKVLFKHLGLGLSLAHQNTSQTAVVRLPANIGTAKLFYHGNLFKNNLQLQVGAQLQVYDAFYSYAYMPSTQVFYIQNKYKAEPYPYLDVFLQARIRPVSFFIKMENALQGLAGPNYAFTPGYYQTDRAFRFGINWVFFD